MSKLHLIATAAAVGLMLAASPALAQFGPTLDKNTTVVEELVVRGYAGPPWWKVSDADTTIYILADPGDLPPGVTFSTRLLELRLTGSKAVIVQPRFTLGLGMIIVAPKGLKLMNQLNGSTKTGLEASLPPDLRTRFVAARTAIGQPETRYGALKPGLARMALAGDTDFARHQASRRRRRVPGRWRASSSSWPRPSGSRSCRSQAMAPACSASS